MISEITSHPQDKIVLEGSRVTFTCRYSIPQGGQQPTATWYSFINNAQSAMDPSIVNNNNGISELTILSAKYTDSAEYSCTVLYSGQGNTLASNKAALSVRG